LVTSKWELLAVLKTDLLRNIGNGFLPHQKRQRLDQLRSLLSSNHISYQLSFAFVYFY
jgi:hypothetical protein